MGKRGVARGRDAGFAVPRAQGEVGGGERGEKYKTAAEVINGALILFYFI